MRRTIRLILCNALAGSALLAQSALDLPQQEERDKAKRAVAKQQERQAQRAGVIEFRGQHAFDEKELRSQLKEQITTIDDFGLTAARGDDLAFFLAVFYRKHGYAKVDVRYVIDSGNGWGLEFTKAPPLPLGIGFLMATQENRQTSYSCTRSGRPANAIRNYKEISPSSLPTFKKAPISSIGFISRRDSSTLCSILRATLIASKAIRWTPSSRFTRGSSIFSATSHLPGEPFTTRRHCVGNCSISCGNRTLKRVSPIFRDVCRPTLRRAVTMM